MEHEYRVTVSARAARQLVAHAAFLARVNREAAERLTAAFEEAAQSLKTMPHRGAWLRGEGLPEGKYRSLLFAGHYLLLYQVRGENVFVEIVVDTRQDYGWLVV